MKQRQDLKGRALILLGAGSLSLSAACVESTQTGDRNTASRTSDQQHLTSPLAEDTAQGDTNPSLPRDTRGVPGSPFASNIQEGELTSKIPLDSFGYDQRAEFKTVVESHLDTIDKGLEEARSTAGSESQKKIKEIDQRQEKLSGRLGEIESASPQEWESTKSEFQSELAELEKQYQSVVARR